MLSLHRAHAVLAYTLIFAAACGGDDRGPTDSAVTDAGDTSVGDAITDGGGDADTAVVLPPDGVLRTSRIWADQYAFGGIETGAAGAQFFDQEPSPVSSTTEDLGGGCTMTTAQLLVEPGMGAFPQYRDAGDIRIEGGAAPIDIVRSGTSFYDSVTTDTRLWDGGAALTITAAGGADIDPFSVSVEAPATIQVTSPTLNLGGAPPIDVDRSADLTVTWMAGTGGEDVSVRVIGPEVEGEPNVTIECRFAPAAGTGTVPAAALGRINRAGMGILGVDVSSERTIAAGAWGNVSIEMSAAAVWATGNRYLATLVIL